MPDRLVDAVEALTRLAESGRDDEEARAEWARHYARFQIRLAELLTREQAAVLDNLPMTSPEFKDKSDQQLRRLRDDLALSNNPEAKVQLERVAQELRRRGAPPFPPERPER